MAREDLASDWGMEAKGVGADGPPSQESTAHSALERQSSTPPSPRSDPSFLAILHISHILCTENHRSLLLAQQQIEDGMDKEPKPLTLALGSSAAAQFGWLRSSDAASNPSMLMEVR